MISKFAIKRIVISFFLSIGMCALGGCETVSEEPTEITFIHGWGSTEADHVAMRQIYSDFEKENPDIHLNMISMPTNREMIRLVEDMITTGNIPDVIFTAGEGKDGIYSFMRNNNMLVDLMSYINADEAFQDSISPIITNTWTTEDGKLFTATDVLILSGGYWYNRDIFEQAGIREVPGSWEEFYQVLETVNDWALQNNPSVEAIRPSFDAYMYMADNYFVEKGVLTEGTPLPLSTQNLSDVLDLWNTVHSYENVNYRNFSYRDEAALFNDNKLAIFINGVWGASMIDPKIKAGYALLPHDEIQSISYQSADLGYLLGNSKNEKKIEAGVRFLKYMLSEEVQKRIILETQQMPSNPNIVISDYYGTLERFSIAVEKVQLAGRRIEIPSMVLTQSQRETIENNMDAFFLEKITKEEFVDLIEQAVD